MISNLLLVLGSLLLILGMIGILRFKKLIPRLMTSTLIDTTAVLTMFTALILRSRVLFHTSKLIILLLITLIISPVLSHVIIRSSLMGKR